MADQLICDWLKRHMADQYTFKVEVYSTITSNDYEDELLTKRRDLYQFLLNLQ